MAAVTTEQDTRLGNWIQENQYVDTNVVYQPEDNPFSTLICDITHRCNMKCANCYLPNRQVPDMELDYFISILKRLPRRTKIRIVGAEPTVRKDLPEFIEWTRKLGHLPLLLTNGLKLADRAYVQTLKDAGLGSIYLSFNGGFDDNTYLQIDEMACAERKTKALENLCDAHFYISLGMILVRGVNEAQLGPVFKHAMETRQIFELKIRSVGRFGRYMENPSFTMLELIDAFCRETGYDRELLMQHYTDGETHIDHHIRRFKLAFTQWPDNGSKVRGRLAPNGTIQPFFEHMMANESGY